MQANRRRDTGPELAVRRLLHARGLRYWVDQRPLPESNFRADLIFPTARIAVFIDGCFWHGCPEHYVEPKTNVQYWRPKIARNVERDRAADATLVAAGWESMRFWEHEDFSTVAARVEAEVRGRRAAQPL